MLIPRRVWVETQSVRRICNPLFFPKNHNLTVNYIPQAFRIFTPERQAYRVAFLRTEVIFEPVPPAEQPSESKEILLITS